MEVKLLPFQDQLMKILLEVIRLHTLLQMQQEMLELQQERLQSLRWLVMMCMILQLMQTVFY